MNRRRAFNPHDLPEKLLGSFCLIMSGALIALIVDFLRSIQP